ncbi:MAG TPA: YafY family protein [Egibacteraceae bacterium]
MGDATARALRLLSLLQTHRDWSGAELAERLGVSARTLRRDIDRLRSLGYPVAATRGVAGGYRLEAGSAMPPLLLDDDEAVAIAVGLRTAAGGAVTGLEESSVRALAKLEQVLPSRLRSRVNALQTSTVPLLAGPPTVDSQTLMTIAFACRDRERLRFGYTTRDGTRGRRLADPHRMVSVGRRWYLVAWDVDREDWRTFRVDRIAPPQPTGIRFQPRPLPQGDAAAFVAEALAATSARYRAVVTLAAPIEVVAERLHPSEGVLEPLDDSTCRLRTGADSVEWLALRLGLLDVDFTVHEPPELVAHLQDVADRFGRAARRAGAAPATGADGPRRGMSQAAPDTR